MLIYGQRKKIAGAKDTNGKHQDVWLGILLQRCIQCTWIYFSAPSVKKRHLDGKGVGAIFFFFCTIVLTVCKYNVCIF